MTAGIHLIPYDRAYIEGLAKRMQGDYAVKSVAPALSIGHMGFSVFKQVFGDKSCSLVLVNRFSFKASSKE